MRGTVVAVPEQAVRLRVNGLRVATWTCTPRALEALAAGRLLAYGFIGGREDILALETGRAERDILAIDAEVPPARAATAIEEADHRRGHGCGPRFLIDCRPDLIERGPATTAPPLEPFPDLFRELYGGSGSGRGSGGLHAAGLSDGSGLRHRHEEVGRHNAADKAIGAALLEGDPLAGLGLVTTARISGEIAAKVARAGLGWIASRSVPTTLAVQIAGVAGIPILARAAGPAPRVFTREDA